MTDVGFVHIRVAHNQTDKSFQKQEDEKTRRYQTERAVTPHTER
jgi:hypothetical protein